MADKVVWTGYIDLEISQRVNRIRKQKGWTKTVLIEEAFRALIAQEDEKGTLQKNGIRAADEENDDPFTQTTTRSGRPAIQVKEDYFL